MLTVERVDNLEGLAALNRPWTQLLSRCSYRNLFLTHEWAGTWWAHFGKGKELWLLLVRDGEELLGIAPMMLGWEWYGGLPVRMLGFLVNRHTSRADFIIADGRKEEAIGALVRYWQDHNRRWDVLRLVHVPKESGNVRVLEEAIGNSKLAGFPARVSRRILTLPIEGTWEKYLGQQTHAFRKNLRQSAKRIRESQMTLVSENDPSRVEQGLRSIFGIEARSRKADFREKRMLVNDKEFYLSLGTMVRLFEWRSDLLVDSEGKTIAGCHAAFHERRCYGFLLYHDYSHSAISPGRRLVADLLAECFRRGDVEEMDFNGNSAFIRSWTNHERVCEVLSACNRGLYSLLIAGLRRLNRNRTKQPRRGSADGRTDHGRAAADSTQATTETDEGAP
jgi:CelD/BcsL family acetyltransferase involved in cellulose biosynthesis